jgi:hypothetical protein
MRGAALFIQGGGGGAHDCDRKLVASLEARLGAGFTIRYPRMPDESEPNYLAWRKHICAELAEMGDGAVLVGHSLGASVLLKVLAEGAIHRPVRGIFLVAAPFMHARDGWQWKELELPANPAPRLPSPAPMFFYQGREDDIVPFAHLALYAKTFELATCRALDGRDHQLNDDLTEVADDIRTLP